MFVVLSAQADLYFEGANLPRGREGPEFLHTPSIDFVAACLQQQIQKHTVRSHELHSQKFKLKDSMPEQIAYAHLNLSKIKSSRGWAHFSRLDF